MVCIGKCFEGGWGVERLCGVRKGWLGFVVIIIFPPFKKYQQKISTNLLQYISYRHKCVVLILILVDVFVFYFCKRCNCCYLGLHLFVFLLLYFPSFFSFVFVFIFSFFYNIFKLYKPRQTISVVRQLFVEALELEKENIFKIIIKN